MSLLTRFLATIRAALAAGGDNADVDLGGKKLVNGAAGTAAAHLVTKQQMETYVGAGGFTDAEAVNTAAIMSVVPAAKGATNVHADFAGNDASNDFPGAFTNPDVPRNLRVTFAGGWDGGNVNVVGTDQFDDPVDEDFVADPGQVVVGAKIFKTVVSATKAAQGAAADAASIGTGDKIGLQNRAEGAFGLLAVDGTSEAVVVDDTEHGFTPTTAPDAAKEFVLVYLSAHEHALA